MVPNFYEFDDDVAYNVNIDNDGDGKPDVTYQFRFKTVITNPNTFLYNTGPITSLDSANWNRRQSFKVTKVEYRKGRQPRTTVLGRGLASPPCNIGPRSTPNYAVAGFDSRGQPRLGREGVLRPAGRRVLRGPRLGVRPGHAAALPEPAPDPDGRRRWPSTRWRSPTCTPSPSRCRSRDLTRDGKVPTDPMSPKAVIGVWGAAYRQKATIRDDRDRGWHSAGPWTQVSRLGNPLFNEVIVPMARKDEWNSVGPDSDSRFAKYVARPELAALLPVLYPGVFPNLAALNKDRADLLAILLTGIPSGLIPGFQNFTGTTQADELRLNVAIPPAASPNRLGLLGGDLAGFPNGRRLTDDIVTVELRAVAGATYPLVDPTFTPDGAVSVIEDGTFNNPGRTFLDVFPYIGLPYAGYDVPAAA